MIKITREAALEYHHRDGVPGKLSVIPSKPLDTQLDLSLAYTPGVAYPVLEIEKFPETSYDYTNKGNLVAVISNGTAILGLGDRGALASKPVMEGKGVLFKKFADIDVYDIEVDTHDPQLMIEVVASIAPTFGGINLEDIRSPECFLIERALQSRLNIPVFHDDQHGTAIILGAALLNSLELTNRKIHEIKVVFSGAGAAGIACANQLVKLGVPVEHIWMCDIAGLVYQGRQEAMFPEKEIYAQGDQPGTLAETLEGADVFIGVSIANILTAEMIQRMCRQPIIFAMANPSRFLTKLPSRLRPDCNCCHRALRLPQPDQQCPRFSLHFSRCLDVHARAINDEMKNCCIQCTGSAGKRTCSAGSLKALQFDHLEFG